MQRSTHMRQVAARLLHASRRPQPNSSLNQCPSRFARYQSTFVPPGPGGPGPVRRFVSSTILLVSGVAFLAYYYDSRSIMHEKIAMPILRLVDPEQGHKLAIKLLSNRWLSPSDKGVDGPELRAELFGLPISNPVGLAAGFDKDGEAIDGLFDLGFGYVEIGSVTPQPQPGNPKPRFFRLTEDEAAINRYGFNSLGHAQMLSQLQSRLRTFSRLHPSLFPNLTRNTVLLPPRGLPRSLRPGQLLAVNLGKNKTSPADSNDDYVRGVRLLGPYADVVVINVSSPNTPGLRALQGREVLEKLLRDVVEERNKIRVDGLPKIAVKVACDLTEEELGDVAGAIRGSGVEGVIVSNTTVKRDELGLQSENASQIGGLSGKPLFPLALQAVRTIRPLLPPSIPVIGCGGIFTSSDALSMARSGSSIVQLYTSFGYRGVGTPRLIKDEISADLARKGETWKAEIGRDWTDKDMGWDERRLEKQSQALKKEAEGLGQMLRKAFDEDDIARLIAEAEKALGGPRDNLAGANSDKAVQDPRETSEVAEALIGAVQEAGPNGLAGRVGGSTAAVSASTSQSAPQQEGVVVSDPIGGPLGPVVVEDVKAVAQQQPEPKEDAWTGAVRRGSKRLV